MTEELIGDSPALRDIRSLVSTIATVSSTVLIRGEQGTGMRRLARLIHREGHDADAPFTDIHFGAIPSGLIEGALFGFEGDSSRTCSRRRLSKFELASKGTLFLREVAELELGMQTKLLRALQDGVIVRFGGVTPITLDLFRLIASTSADLEKAVEEGRFCEDLYYQLNVIPLRIPPLRERSSDIPLLLEHFWKILCERQGSAVSKPTLGAGVMNALSNHPWPGNVRELMDTVDCLWTLAADRTIERGDLPPAIRS